jgi:EpsI family protein
MTLLRWRALLAAMVMLLAAGLSFMGRPTIHLADRIGQPDLERMFPAQFGDWRVAADRVVVAPAPDVQAQLDALYNQVLTRNYVNSAGEMIMLSVAYGGDQSEATRAHRPEICYPAQGFNVTWDQPAQLSVAGGTLPVRTLMTHFGSRNEPITYWIVVGQEVVTSGMQQKLAQMRYGLRGLIPDGMLVRVSSIDADRDDAYGVQARFIADLAESMPLAERPRAFGELAH